MVHLVNSWLSIPVLASISLILCGTSSAEDLQDEKHHDESTTLQTTWVDSSHSYASDQTQALAEWMDDFFGDPEYDLEQAESKLRLELIDDWESKDGHEFKVRLRGKMQLPKISKRLNLVFSGEESDLDDESAPQLDDSVGIQYNVDEDTRSRLDLTLGYASSNLRPGIKYRYEGSFDDRNSYRLVERVQYEDGEGFFSNTQVDLNHSLNENNILRWSNRALWGEHSEGVEWRSRLTLRQRIRPEAERPLVLGYSASVSGVTRPEDFVKNYRLGVLWRQQIYRDFLFLELEPAYNYRKRRYEDDRDSVWSMVVRLEIALERDLNPLSSSKEKAPVETR